MRQEACNHLLLETPLATEPEFPTIRLNVSVTFTPSKITPCNNVPLQKLIITHLINQKIHRNSWNPEDNYRADQQQCYYP